MAAIEKKLLSLTFFLFLSCSLLIGQELQKINGRITDSGSPLEGVGITIEDSDESTSSNTDGTYQLQVRPGDVIKYEFIGFRDAFYVEWIFKKGEQGYPSFRTIQERSFR